MLLAIPTSKTWFARAALLGDLFCVALGLLLNVVVHLVDVQDREGALLPLRRARREDGARCLANGSMEAGDREAIDVSGFEVLPKRWIVERTFAWISGNRRLTRDFERYAMTVAAFVRLAMIRIMLMLRRLAVNAWS